MKVGTGPVGGGGVSKTAPGKELWADRGGHGGQGVRTKAEVVPAAQPEPSGR